MVLLGVVVVRAFNSSTGRQNQMDFYKIKFCLFYIVRAGVQPSRWVGQVLERRKDAGERGNESHHGRGKNLAA